MAFSGNHLILAKGADIEAAMVAVRKFFDESILLNYDLVQCNRELSCSAFESVFWEKLEEGVTKNREVLAGFLREMEENGVKTLSELQNVPQGYQSKLLHLIAHFVDGFIGIDSAFYNLADDSHWLTEATRTIIAAEPQHYWLLHVEVSFADRKGASFL